MFFKSKHNAMSKKMLMSNSELKCTVDDIFPLYKNKVLVNCSLGVIPLEMTFLCWRRFKGNQQKGP